MKFLLSTAVVHAYELMDVYVYVCERRAGPLL